MQIEKNNPLNRLGWIEVICGSMFSGKTEELIRRLKRAKIAQQKVEVFKPEIEYMLLIFHPVGVNTQDFQTVSKIMSALKGRNLLTQGKALCIRDTKIW